MNTPIVAHLRKEWREQRFALLQTAVLLAALFLATAMFLPADLRDDPIVRAVAALLPLVVVCGTIVPDLLAREHEAGTIAFLARTPGALRIAWFAKLAFAIVVALGAWAVGAFAAGRLFAAPDTPDPARWAALDQPFLSVSIVALVAWTFAVSALLSNRFLALPCAAMFTAATIAPLLQAAHASDGFAHLRVDQAAVFTMVPLGATLGLVASWFAFVRGPRVGRSRRWITNVGFVGCLLGLLPSTAPAAYRAAFPQRDVSLEPVAITDDGEFLFHRVERSASNESDDRVQLVRVDLGTRDVGVEDDRMAFELAPAARHGSPWIFRGLHPVVGDIDEVLALARSAETLPVVDGHPDPADFGRPDVVRRFTVACVGAGHALRVHGAAESTGAHFRDRDGEIARGLDELRALATDLAIEDAVPTTGDRWLVRDDRRAWWWFDVRTGDREPCTALAADSRVGWCFGPSTAGGALLVTDDAGLKIIDANTREARAVTGGEDVLRLLAVLDDQACALLADDASVWLGATVGTSLDDLRQAAIRIDLASATVSRPLVIDDPRARLLAANDDGLLYQQEPGGDIRWCDAATGSSRTLLRVRR